LEQKELDLGEEPGCVFWEPRAWPGGGGADGAMVAFASGRPGAVADSQLQPPDNNKSQIINYVVIKIKTLTARSLWLAFLVSRLLRKMLRMRLSAAEWLALGTARDGCEEGA
jgi:hypothetical protein